MATNRDLQLPPIPAWPEHREAPTAHELAEVTALVGADEEDLLLRQKEVRVFLDKQPLDTLRVLADRVVDLYLKAENTNRGAAKDYGITSRCVWPYAAALLEALEDHDDGAEDIAYRLVRGAAIANRHQNTYLSQIGLAAKIDFPAYLGQKNKVN
jgi:hypothetical protein